MKKNRDKVEYEILTRERDIQRIAEEERIKKTRYNKKYKELCNFEGCPSYLKNENLEEMDRGEEVRALIKLRCGNLEKANKYWLKKDQWTCFAKKVKIVRSIM